MKIRSTNTILQSQWLKDDNMDYEHMHTIHDLQQINVNETLKNDYGQRGGCGGGDKVGMANFITEVE